MNSSNFGYHLIHLGKLYDKALRDKEFNSEAADGILIHSGSEDHYFADDRAIPFQPYGHFCHWIPVSKPDQFILVLPGQTPIYFQLVPDDFWYDQTIDTEDWWTSGFEIVKLKKLTEITQHLPKSNLAYLGPNPDVAKKLKISRKLINPKALLSYLDYHRAIKTDYELDQLRAANRLALRGHAAAKKCFLNGGNEYEIHMAYLQAGNILEDECPYTNIVAIGTNANILHYQHKRHSLPEENHILLIDAGARVNGYGSDITRTIMKEDTHKTFQALHRDMEKLQQKLFDMVKPGLAFQELHHAALMGIATILSKNWIYKSTAESIYEEGIAHLFMPHGVGHLLGIQVHDVGGHQQDEKGAMLAPPDSTPALRTTRIMEENMVFTIEPGFYFIDQMFEIMHGTDHDNYLNWDTLSKLVPIGGIRIEDNVRVTATGAENLTRSRKKIT